MTAWVAAKPQKAPASSGSGFTLGRLLRWLFLALALFALFLVLKKPAPPAASLPPTRGEALAAAASFRAKLGALQDAHERGNGGQEARFTEAELNAYVQQSTGALPPPQEPDAGAQDDAGAAAAAIQSTSVGMSGDEIAVQIGVERFGRVLYFTLAGRLAAQDGYVTLHPTRCKLGALNVPLGFVGELVQKKLAEPENREKLKLPDYIQDLRVENGELVVVEK